MDCCPHCQQPLIAGYDRPVINFRLSTVTYRGKTAQFTPVELEMFEYLLDAGERGVTKATIWAEMYRDRSDGEMPDWKVFDVRLCHIRRALRRGGVEIDIDTSAIRGRESRCWLVYGHTPGRRHQ